MIVGVASISRVNAFLEIGYSFAEIGYSSVPSSDQWYTLTANNSGSYSTEAFAAPVHAPDFKTHQVARGSAKRFARLYAPSRVSLCAPSARQLRSVAGRWLHFGDTASDRRRSSLSGEAGPGG